MSQFLEVLEHYDPSGEEIAFRYPPEGSADVKFGAQLVVHEAQEAVCSTATGAPSTCSAQDGTR